MFEVRSLRLLLCVILIITCDGFEKMRPFIVTAFKLVVTLNVRDGLCYGFLDGVGTLQE